MALLPLDIIPSVLRYLPPPDLARAALVSRVFRAEADRCALWAAACTRATPPWWRWNETNVLRGPEEHAAVDEWPVEKWKAMWYEYAVLGIRGMLVPVLIGGLIGLGFVRLGGLVCSSLGLPGDPNVGHFEFFELVRGIGAYVVPVLSENQHAARAIDGYAVPPLALTFVRERGFRVAGPINHGDTLRVTGKTLGSELELTRSPGKVSRALVLSKDDRIRVPLLALFSTDPYGNVYHRNGIP